MISCERWKDGIVVTVEGIRILRHSSSTPAIYIEKERRRAGPKGAAAETGAGAVAAGAGWQGMGPCSIINEGPDRTVLQFPSLCAVRIFYKGRVLRLCFEPEPSAAARGMKISLGTTPREKILGAGPTTEYDMKRSRVRLPAPMAGESGESGDPGERIPAFFSTQGRWTSAECEGATDWNFKPASTELTCDVFPSEIAVGFGKTPAMGIELLVRYRAGKRRGGRNVARRERLPERLQSGLVLDARARDDGGESILETLRRMGIIPAALIARKGSETSGPEGACARVGSPDWEKALNEAFARPLRWKSGENGTASGLVTSILSLSAAGEGHVFAPALAQKSAAEKSDARTAPVEMAAFGPLFVTETCPDATDPAAARRFIAAAKIFEALKPYRDLCAEEWTSKGMPAFVHPAFRYPEETILWERDDQLMFGPDLFMAPSPEGSPRARKLRLPDDEWIHLWTSRHYAGGVAVVDAPADRPAVFYRSASAFAKLFDEIRQKATRL